MIVQPLKHEEMLRTGATHLVEITHEDLTESTNATAQTLEAIDVAANDMVECMFAELVETFKDGDVANADSTELTVGDGSDVDRFLGDSTAMEINGEASQDDRKLGNGTRYFYTSSDTVDVQVTSDTTPTTAYALADLDQGIVHLYFRILKDSNPREIPEG